MLLLIKSFGLQRLDPPILGRRNCAPIYSEVQSDDCD